MRSDHKLWYYLDNDPFLSPSEAAQLAWDNYETDFEDFWGVDGREMPPHLAEDDWMDEDVWREYVRLHQLAQKLAGACAHLLRPSRLREQEKTLPDLLAQESDREATMIREILEKIEEKMPDRLQDFQRCLSSLTPSSSRGKRRFFLNCLEMQADSIFPHSAERQSRRLLRLSEYMQQKAGLQTQRFLRRLGECYVREMEPELAVMARAALESALKEVVTDEAFTHPRSNRVGLSERIEKVMSLGLLNDRAYKAARDVNKWGSAAVHDDTISEASSEQVLDGLVTVLSALEDFLGPKNQE